MPRHTFPLLALCSALLLLIVDAFAPVPRVAVPPSSPAAGRHGKSLPGAADMSLRAAAVSQEAMKVNEKKPKFKLPGTCDHDFECEASEFCCEYLVFKMCCSDGTRSESDFTPVLVPIPIPVERYPYPGGYGGYGGYR
jgi:hypothetical protein